MNVIPAQPKDLTRIIQLRHNAFLERAPEYYNETEVQNLLGDYDESEILDMVDQQCLFLIDDDGKLLGTSGWKGENVRHVYVNPDFMGRGIGRNLLSHAEADYKRRTRKNHLFAGVILYARGFYEKNGYRVLRKDHAWDGSEYYLMKKSLEDVPKI